MTKTTLIIINNTKDGTFYYYTLDSIDDKIIIDNITTFLNSKHCKNTLDYYTSYDTFLDIVKNVSKDKVINSDSGVVAFNNNINVSNIISLICCDD